jgi:hypothetical protein
MSTAVRASAFTEPDRPNGPVDPVRHHLRQQRRRHRPRQALRPEPLALPRLLTVLLADTVRTTADHAAGH